MSDPRPGPVPPVPALVETRLYRPPWRAGLVERPRLVERLREGLGGRLTLICAPPGFGKTTLLAEWTAELAKDGRGVGWVSLDPGIDEPAAFWTYVATALERARPGAAARALALLGEPRPPPERAALTALINDLHAAQGEVVLVLDDFHAVAAGPIHEGVSFLLDQLPAGLHLVIAGRSQPPLPLARLRARAQLLELGAADLRFTPEEAATFLHRAMVPGLSAADVAILEERTEGWIAALQLAALSMRGQGDASRFLAGFSGDHRFVADYLVEEVLQRQPVEVRSFLVETSILERMTGPLCDAVTGGSGGSARLEALERGNLFVVPLDDRRRWYRYHHLFSDVLRSRLREEDPDRIPDLHRRASAWHEAAGSPAEAAHHALAAGELERAADLIEGAWTDENSFESATWKRHVEALPDAMVRSRPVLSMRYAWALLGAGDLEAGEARLRDVERGLAGAARPGAEAPVPPPDVVVRDPTHLRALPVELATAHTYLAQARGDTASAVSHARRLLELVPEEDERARAPAWALLGLACWADGELEGALRSFSAGMESLERGGDSRSAIGGSFVLGDMLAARGRLREAAATYRRSIERAEAQPRPAFPGLGELHLGLAELHLEWGELDAAELLLGRASAFWEEARHPGQASRWKAASARLLAARGDADGALEMLDEAERLRTRSPLPEVRPPSAVRARLLIACGRLDEAEHWARGRGLSPEDAPSYLREFEHLTLARLLLACHGRDGRALAEAGSLLGRLLSAAEEGGRTGSAVEIQFLQALALQAGADGAGALATLGRALQLAEPEGYLRLFVDEGDAARRLLRSAAHRGVGGEYARRLLAAFYGPARPSAPPGVAGEPPGRGEGHPPALTRPLTLREIEILRLIASGMRTRDIARHLFISPATVKRHIANAYGKLDVGHRTAAVARAHELEIL